MTKATKKFSSKWMKGIEEEINLVHRMRSTPFSFHRVGNLVKPVSFSKEEIEDLKNSKSIADYLKKQRRKRPDLF